jgi:putative restriction endonuclease
MTRRNWTLEETMMAFALYLVLPPKDCDDTGADVRQLASALERTPDAVALKLWNIAAHDANRTKLGKVGMQHGSKLDEEIWNLYTQDSDNFLAKAALLLSDALANNRLATPSVTYAYINSPEGKEREAIVSQRINQQYFRNTLLRNYGNQCCITGLAVEQLLVASHIKPWKDSDPRTERLSPYNGLLLNALHDRAFDGGLITIDSSYRIRVSPKVKTSPASQEWLFRFDGETVTVPKDYPPGKEFIEYHNDMVFLR